MSVRVEVDLNGVCVPLVLDEAALATIAAALQNGAGGIELLQNATPARTSSFEFLTVPEAAELLRCDRQRIDDLLSQRRLTRVKDGRRTLVRRAEIDLHLRRTTRRTAP